MRCRTSLGTRSKYAIEADAVDAVFIDESVVGGVSKILAADHEH